MVLYIGQPHWEPAGSGGGTWLCRHPSGIRATKSFGNWIGDEKYCSIRGGQSRRHTVGPSGKILTSILIFQLGKEDKNSGQNPLQLRFYERDYELWLQPVWEYADRKREMYMAFGKALPTYSRMQTVCYGLWVNPFLKAPIMVCICSDRKKAGGSRLHVTETFSEELEGLSKLIFPDGHRYLNF